MALRKLSSKLVVTQIVFLAVAVTAIGLTLFISWRLEGTAAAINDAGSLRMRAYRLAYLAGAQSAAPSAETRATIEREVVDFATVFNTLRVGDPARPLFLPKSATVERQMQALAEAWRALAPSLTSADGPDRAQVEGFVSLVNTLVRSVEDDVATSTSLLRATQFGLIALAIAGAVALMYLSFLFVVRPVNRLQDGLERMARADFSARVPVESHDEFGALAQGFNTMADQLHGLYSTLEARVAEKTRSLAEQNRRLATLYDMTSFLGSPHTIEELCRGFVRRIVNATGAKAGAVRLSNSGDGAVHMYAAEGLPERFLSTEDYLRCGECACGESAERGRIMVQTIGEKRAVMTLPHCREAGFRSVVAVPIAAQQHTVGIFNLFFDEARELGVEERHMLETLGSHLGVTIESLRLVSRDKELAVSEERNLLAQELHDSIAQALAFLNLQVQMLRDAIRKEKRDEVRAIVAEIEAGVKESYADVRELLTHFRTRVAQADLEHSLRGMLAKFEHQTGIATHLEVSGTGVTLAPDAQLQVAHVVHEALSNARKHSGCSRVDVELERGPTYRLTVRDDGRGFDPAARDEASHDDHVGLRIMRERANRVGASVAVRSSPGAGTEVTLTLPVARMEAAA
jgi:two-component system nitrate/nitrite sensor histidine kinase NarX